MKRRIAILILRAIWLPTLAVILYYLSLPWVKARYEADGPRLETISTNQP